MTEFKVAKIEDIPLIQNVAYNTWPDTFGDVMPKEQIEYMLKLQYSTESLCNQISSQNHIFILVYIDDKVVGYASIELNYKNTPQLMIHKAYLLPEIQGQGIGKELFVYLTNTAMENSQNALRLKVFYKNERAIGFYKKNGFLSNGTEKTDIGRNYIIIDNVMVKQLNE